MVDDPRITRVGHWLRKYSIDEIPQLVNVLRGEMSLVGPRPHPLDDVALYDDVATRRLLAKPGMTGLWQVSGRSNLDWEKAVGLDLYYVENWSLGADVAILLRTVKVVLSGSGAY
jgi:lipopolysaccharide/colanic/teichoic acid biosynthesis glycosyltransferase